MDTHPSRVVDLLPALMRYARRLTRDEHDAEDLVQEALVAACANADKYQPGRPLRVWMFAIVHNAFVSRRRRDAVRVLLSGHYAWRQDLPKTLYHLVLTALPGVRHLRRFGAARRA